jgi:cysteine synthase
MIDFTINKAVLESNIREARRNHIILPTISQLKNPETIPQEIRDRLASVGMQEFSPLNLFRITWKNEPKDFGGGYGAPNILELPPSLTGVRARIFCLVGKWFPTGCHKVGAAYGCMVPKLVTGQFDVVRQKSVWPSTGNFCRGGAFNAKILSCESIAVMPDNMSRERFEWLSGIVGETIRISGGDSNVKAVFDCVNELKRNRPDAVIFNQFEEMGNPLWHYNVTGRALGDLFEAVRKPGQRLAGACFTSGSAGTMSAGDLLKERYPRMKLAVGEALQCPTILNNGFGGHRIEGIGDKHIPWIHNVKNTDMAIAIDDEDSQRLLRLFNCQAGREYMKSELGLDDELIEKMSWLGISGIANVLCCIKMAKYYEFTADDVVCTVLTDSAVMYQSRINELNEMHGEYDAKAAAIDHNLHMLGLKTDNLLELTYAERKRVHNLKYYTWVEQQGRTVEDLNAQWYDTRGTWDAVHEQAAELDELIDEFNEATGVLEK